MALTTQFLTNIRQFLLENNGDELKNWLRVDDAVGEQYFNLSRELKTAFHGTKVLDQLVERSLPEEDDVPEGRGSPWPGFVSFMKEYLQYWRRVDFQDLVACYELLSGLVTYVLCFLCMFSGSRRSPYIDHVPRHSPIPPMEQCCSRRASRSRMPSPSWSWCSTAGQT